MARTHVIIADDVLHKIDQLVGQRGRSRFLDEAAREKLARTVEFDAFESAFGIIDPADYPQWRDREVTAATVREGRRSHQ